MIGVAVTVVLGLLVVSGGRRQRRKAQILVQPEIVDRVVKSKISGNSVFFCSCPESPIGLKEALVSSRLVGSVCWRQSVNEVGRGDR
jgi:hypothetical protein